MFQCIFIILAVINSCFTCSYIKTSPENDIIEFKKESFQITCCLNSSNPSLNATKLISERNTTTIEEEVSVINDSCILFSPQTDLSCYYCRIKNVTQIDIVKSFECYGYNFVYFKCSWEGYPQVEYQAYLESNFGLTNISVEHINDTNKFGFNLERRQYDLFMTHENLNLSIHGISEFGNERNKNFLIKHHARIKLSAPVLLICSYSTAHSAYLTWYTSETVNEYLGGIIDHNVEYAIIKDEFNPIYDWNSYNITKPKKTRGGDRKEGLPYWLNLTQLPYANKKYSVRICYKAWFENSPCSNYSSVNFTTLEDLPNKPPDTTMGSFYINHNQNLIDVYWKQIDDDERNGGNFSYLVYDEKSGLFPETKTLSYATFKYTNSEPLNIAIVASNALFNSSNISYVHVPRKDDILEAPTHLTKYVVGNGHYQLNWKVPESTKAKLIGYTIFWCSNEIEILKKCNDRLDFKNISSLNNSILIDDLPNDKSHYTFAISANSENSSSGMVWKECEISKESDVKGRDHGSISINANAILLKWELECVYPDGFIQEFNIEYCKLNEENQCVHLQNKTVSDTTAGADNITDLEAYTKYSFNISANSKPPFVTKIIERTKEGIPSEPINIEIFNITNKSMTVKWDPPLKPRGIIKQYVIYNAAVKLREIVDAKEIKNCITNVTCLKSNTMYNIRIRAKTSYGFSNFSSPCLVKTAEGTPSNITTTYVSGVGGKYNFSWHPPDDAGGPVTTYEVRVSKDGYQPNIYPTEKEFYLLECGGEFTVRAVSHDKNKTVEFKGNWSDPVSVNCPTEYLLLAGCVLFSIFSLSLSLLFCKKIRLYLKKKMDLPVDVLWLGQDKQEVKEELSDEAETLLNGSITVKKPRNGIKKPKGPKSHAKNNEEGNVMLDLLEKPQLPFGNNNTREKSTDQIESETNLDVNFNNSIVVEVYDEKDINFTNKPTKIKLINGYFNPNESNIQTNLLTKFNPKPSGSSNAEFNCNINEQEVNITPKPKLNLLNFAKNVGGYVPHTDSETLSRINDTNPVFDNLISNTAAENNIVYKPLSATESHDHIDIGSASKVADANGDARSIPDNNKILKSQLKKMNDNSSKLPSYSVTENQILNKPLLSTKSESDDNIDKNSLINNNKHKKAQFNSPNFSKNKGGYVSHPDSETLSRINDTNPVIDHLISNTAAENNILNKPLSTTESESHDKIDKNSLKHFMVAVANDNDQKIQNNTHLLKSQLKKMNDNSSELPSNSVTENQILNKSLLSTKSESDDKMDKNSHINNNKPNIESNLTPKFNPKPICSSNGEINSSITEQEVNNTPKARLNSLNFAKNNGGYVTHTDSETLSRINKNHGGYVPRTDSETLSRINDTNPVFDNLISKTASEKYIPNKTLSTTESESLDKMDKNSPKYSKIAVANDNDQNNQNNTHLFKSQLKKMNDDSSKLPSNSVIENQILYKPLSTPESESLDKIDKNSFKYSKVANYNDQNNQNNTHLLKSQLNQINNNPSTLISSNQNG